MKYILVFFFLTSIVNAQKVERLRHQVTDREGLPDKNIFRVIEDDNGFVWLATNSGLYKYDGEDYKLYSHPKQKGTAVFNLTFDNTNRLWFNNISGQFFYIENDEVILFKDYKEKTHEKLMNFSLIDGALYIPLGLEVIKTNVASKKDSIFKTRDIIHAAIIKYKNEIYAVNDYHFEPLKDFKTQKINFENCISPFCLNFNNDLLYINTSLKVV